MHDAVQTTRARRWLPAAVVVFVLGVFAAVVGLNIGGTDFVTYFDDIVTALAAFLAAALCLHAGLKQIGRLRRFWLLFAAATGAWGSAETIWAVYDLVLRRPVPVPSWADIGYLSAIPLAALALLSHPAMRAVRLRSARAILDGATIATALLFLSWSFLLGPLWRSTDLTTAGGIVAVAYPFGDVVLLFLVVLAIRNITGGDRLALWCLLAGLVAMATSDSIYTYLTETSRYSTGHLLDTGWVAAYLGIALAAFVADRAQAAPSNDTATEVTAASLIVPFLPVLVALLAAGIRTSLGHRVDRTGWLMALALTVLVLVRQGLLLLHGWPNISAIASTGPGAGTTVGSQPRRASVGRGAER